MPKVYITQVPHRKDAATGAWVPSVNIAPANEHGEVVVMMPPKTSFYATGDLIEQLARHLCNYDYDAGDVLVAIGDPVVIGCACAYLARKFGKWTLAKWDRQICRYVKVTINMEGRVE